MTTTNSRWDQRALCKNKWDLFFPEVDDDGIEIGSTKEARQICAKCPVRSECLDDAIAGNMQYGIAGGLNYRERQSLKTSIYRHTRRQGFEEALDEVLINFG